MKVKLLAACAAGALTLAVAGPLAAQGKPTAAEAKALVDKAEADLQRIDGYTTRTAWVRATYIIPETLWLDAKAPAALVPGNRPRSTLSPGIALRDGEAYLAFGTPGGDQQDQWAAQLLLRHIHAKQNLQEAIDCPAILSSITYSCRSILPISRTYGTA